MNEDLNNTIMKARIAEKLSNSITEEIYRTANKIKFNTESMYYIILTEAYSELKDKTDFFNNLLETNIRNSYDYHEVIQALDILHDKDVITTETRNSLIKNYLVDKISKEFTESLSKYLNMMLEGKKL